MKVAILYSTFFDPSGKERKIGGIETYLLNLAGVCQELGITPTIYQWSRISFSKTIDGIDVVGIEVLHLPYKKRSNALFKHVKQAVDPDKDLIVFGSDQQTIKSKARHVIAIQHGISWDLPTRFLSSHKIFHKGFLGTIYKSWIQRRYLALFERCSNSVCVDNNFVNWYRTQLAEEPRGRIWVVPNFANIATQEKIQDREGSNKVISILFARRFQEYRGTRILAESARYILDKFPNVTFTLAGEGPDEEWLKTYLSDQNRVTFIRYLPEESLRIHLDHDIAVIPSLASEGTSLSVAEAMGAGCAVIATNVGGITNMIINNYNGIIVAPTKDYLTEALVELVTNVDLRKTIARNGYAVARACFTIDEWRSSWEKIIQKVIQ